MLEVNDVHAGYESGSVLHGIDLTVDADELVALVGSNGAGKTTLTRAICGLLPISHGEIWLEEERIDGLPTHEIVERGIIQIPEERELFTHMTVEENLLLGAQTDRAAEAREENVERVYDLFPRLAERTDQIASQMSGGEQQMLAVARALMGDPELLILDEPSIGLAPQLVTQVFDIIADIHESGLPVLIIEQNVRETLTLVDRGYVLENGQVTMEGSGDALLDDDQIRQAYLGI